MLGMAKQIGIQEAGQLLNRRPATLRHWERESDRGNLNFPSELRSQRNLRGWRYWTPEQIVKIKEWMVAEDMRPGKGLPHYHPNEAQIARHIEGQRKPRKTRINTDTITDGSEFVATTDSAGS